MEPTANSMAWVIGDHKDEINDSEGYLVCMCSRPSSQDEIDAAAIVSAVNNTWGKGINPEEVYKMYKMLELLHATAALADYEREAIDTLLNSAKL